MSTTPRKRLNDENAHTPTPVRTPTSSIRFQPKSFNTLKENLLWSIRIAQWSHDFPESYEELKWDGVEEHQVDAISFASKFWELVEPFFASRGYTLYVWDLRSGTMTPRDLPKVMQAQYPFSRIVQSNVPTTLGWGSFLTWPARDHHGRDVMIKAISDVSQPSIELKVMMRLNEKALRSNPFNHTIHALEFLTFNGIVFVVMPRWDAAFLPDFSTVSELMELTKTLLEAFAFLHEHRIVHHDFLPQNTGMNVVISGSNIHSYQGLRDRNEVRYVLYDFGHALMYPEGSVIHEQVETRPLMNYAFRNANIRGPYNPFKADIALLGMELQRRVRHIENIVPELGPFFDRLVGTLDPNQFSASQALRRFMQIYRGLSQSQLQTPVHTWMWDDGKILKKQRH